MRLIDQDGEQVGIVETADALQRAEASELDLVEISPNAEPPVCRIMDYGKFLFQQKKRKSDAKKKQHKTQLKELKYRPGIEEGDYQVKFKQLVKFLDAGDKVKLTVRFRGREVAHRQLGVDVLKRMEKELLELAIVEQSPRFEGRQVVMVVAPKKKPQ